MKPCLASSSRPLPRRRSPLLAFLALLALSLAGVACVDEVDEHDTDTSKASVAPDSTSPIEPRRPVCNRLPPTDPLSGPGTQTLCANNYDCGPGNRCWYGSCIAGANYCSTHCDCGLGTACWDYTGTGVTQCGPSAGPYPSCHCDANCAPGGSCVNGQCTPKSGGGGGGGCLTSSEPPPGGIPSDPKGPPPKS